jgi:hypothetical protein
VLLSGVVAYLALGILMRTWIDRLAAYVWRVKLAGG